MCLTNQNTIFKIYFRAGGGWSASSDEEDEEEALETFTQNQTEDISSKDTDEGAAAVQEFCDDDNIVFTDMISRLRTVVNIIKNGDVQTGVFTVINILKSEEN